MPRWHFNPLPRKEGDATQQRVLQAAADFNPLPRKEGDVLECRFARLISISIHSLVKRETFVKIASA